MARCLRKAVVAMAAVLEKRLLCRELLMQQMQHLDPNAWMRHEWRNQPKFDLTVGGRPNPFILVATDLGCLPSTGGRLSKSID